MLIRSLCKKQEQIVFVDGSYFTDAIIEWTLLVTWFDNCAHHYCVLELISHNVSDLVFFATHHSCLDSNSFLYMSQLDNRRLIVLQ